MGAQIEFSHSLTLHELADAIDEVERRVRAALLPAARVISSSPTSTTTDRRPGRRRRPGAASIGVGVGVGVAGGRA